MEDWELKAMNSMIDDMRAGKKTITGRNYSEGMMWYEDKRLSKLTEAKLTELSCGNRFVEIESTEGDPLTYISTCSGFELLHEGSLYDVFNS